MTNSPAERPGLDLLRLLTCGSVDDGKSTLIGRLLFDCRALHMDQLKALAEDTSRFGTAAPGELDFALLVDGLEAEREQGITIDVAYRYFASGRRRFIVADAPGHEQYTRNMATAASTAELAVLLVDARKGLLTQTFRHSYIVSLMGIRHVVLVVNKMDAVGWDRRIFEDIASAYGKLATEIGIADVACIPISALRGDNVVSPSANMTWYVGPTLIAHLESVDVSADCKAKPFRMPVQWVNRPDQTFRGYSGTIASGLVRPGDRIALLPSGQTTQIARIATMDGDLDCAAAGDSVTLTISDNIDIGRGDVLAADKARPVVAEQFAAHPSAAAARPLLFPFDGHLSPPRPGDRAETQGQREHARAHCCQAPRPQRDRILQRYAPVRIIQAIPLMTSLLLSGPISSLKVGLTRYARSHHVMAGTLFNFRGWNYPYRTPHSTLQGGPAPLLIFQRDGPSKTPQREP